MISTREALLVGSVLGVIAGNGCAQEKALPQYPDSAAAEHAGEEAVVTGKVVAVSKAQGGTTYLNFGDRFPRQTFSAVVLPRDEANVGDVKQFEGKTVAVAGRIEMLAGKKPQIVVREPGKIALVENAGKEPAASAAPAPKPTPPAPASTTAKLVPPAPPISPATKPSAPAARKIVLARDWDSPAQGGALTRKDLATVFAGRGAGNVSTDADAPIVMWAGIPYLTPLAEVKKRLKLEGASVNKTKVATPGLPLGSFWNHTFSGVFEGGYNRLCLITDLTDQLVSVQLVEDSPRMRSKEITNTFGFHTYNFVSGRSKGAEALVIKHEVVDGPPGVVVVESTLINPNDREDSPPPKPTKTVSGQKKIRKPSTGEVMEMSRWIVPVPIVQLIMTCAEGR